jgi:hypothetical protein
MEVNEYPAFCPEFNYRGNNALDLHEEYLSIILRGGHYDAIYDVQTLTQYPMLVTYDKLPLHTIDHPIPPSASAPVSASAPADSFPAARAEALKSELEGPPPEVVVDQPHHLSPLEAGQSNPPIRPSESTPQKIEPATIISPAQHALPGSSHPLEVSGNSAEQSSNVKKAGGKEDSIPDKLTDQRVLDRQNIEGSHGDVSLPMNLSNQV